jgi:hypothetical protein
MEMGGAVEGAGCTVMFTGVPGGTVVFSWAGSVGGASITTTANTLPFRRIVRDITPSSSFSVISSQPEYPTSGESDPKG